MDAGRSDGGGPSCGPDDTEYHPTGTHWDYSEAEDWAMLSPMFAMCDGMNQTPIDIPGTTTVETRALELSNYGTAPLRLVNNGHTLQINIDTSFSSTDPSVTFDGTVYYLIQFHGHTPSEHTVDGVSYAMEWHFVHATDDTPTARLLVLGVFFEEGEENNAVIQTILDEDPGDHCERERAAIMIPYDALRPASPSFYHYAPGSLTTPPCTEGLNWFLMASPLSVGAGQVSRFSEIVHGANNRPIQDLNGRAVSLFTPF